MTHEIRTPALALWRLLPEPRPTDDLWRAAVWEAAATLRPEPARTDALRRARAILTTDQVRAYRRGIK